MDFIAKDVCKDKHAYSVRTCRKCGTGFCYGCCAGKGVRMRKVSGLLYVPTFMLCPVCGTDFYGHIT